MVRTKQGKRVPGDEVAEDEAQVGSTTQEETKPAPTENGAPESENLPDSTAEAVEAATAPADEASPALENGEAAPAPTAAEEKKKRVKKEKTKEKVEGEEEEKDKKKKKSLPAWATVSESTKSKLATSTSVKVQRPRLVDDVINAIETCADSRGNATAGAIRSFLASEHPECPKHMFKKVVLNAVEKKIIKQTKGTGFTGKFRIESSGKKGSKGKNKVAAPKESLDDILPLAFTWACNPKESSVNLIKKYIGEHYPDLDVEGGGFRKAIEGGEAKGQLKRISGKGMSGTFALVDRADKTGAKYEDAIESAIIAMNEPKECSVTKIRDYLGAYHPEFETDNKPHLFKKALERNLKNGWIIQMTGKGFTGSFRLGWPYYPSPRVLWGDEYKEKSEKPAKKRAAAASHDSEDGESEEEEEEIVPPSKKRAAPNARSTVLPAAKKSKTVAKNTTAVVAKKSKPIVAKKSKTGKKRSRK
ncbi:heterochromatin protein 1-binding protein 3 isoform X2 [Eurytemora carolleeae]|nr:heterochromatin protein 1-binding protein 3 isoform X2 [Eurytemora carolleeae]XP_023334850.1 heterochromatin protein 1-binding protein 3 isoform X2 [Eurytemora carolleeae]|eukprot:XP_023334848.1 heterochromatin protein 1-binding protein 3-like isoform X2 [Eurytemora affinis]